jgi:SAM-dependent methyltransferase
MNLFPAIRIEGGLLGPDILEDLLEEGLLPGQKPEDFGFPEQHPLRDEIAATFTEAQEYWQVFQRRLARLPETDLATNETRSFWIAPFLALLGYDLYPNPAPVELSGLRVFISHRAGSAEDAPPVHIVGARQSLDRLPPKGHIRLAPHTALQEYLNRTEHLWGLLTNGLTIRLLRNSTFIRRQSYVEFDLRKIFEDQRYQEFGLLYRLVHRTRLPSTLDDAPDCYLEKYYCQAIERGGRVRDRLRDGFKAYLTHFANGFLQHPDNTHLRQCLTYGLKEPHHRDALSPQKFYEELLWLGYRLLFLLVAEARDLLSPSDLYKNHYGVTRLRRLVDLRDAYATDQEDLWHGLRVLWKVLDEPDLAPYLDLTALNGQLFEPLLLDTCALANRDFLLGFWHLVYYRESPTAPLRRVNYAALDVEELGSVYESLLDYQPVVQQEYGRWSFDLVPGSARKSTGSYYTPSEIVSDLIRHTLEPVVQARLQAAPPSEKEAALLSLRILDPACGSGHFLLAAARYVGKTLARLRSGGAEPTPATLRQAVRDVVSHCLYGVDKNRLAVELCRVALWIESHNPDKPLTFLAHRIRWGDSLVGVTDLSCLSTGIPDEAFEPLRGDNRRLATDAKKRNRLERTGKRYFFAPEEALLHIAKRNKPLHTRPEYTIADVHAKAKDYRALCSDLSYQNLQLACDLWIAAFFQTYRRKNAPFVTTETLRTLDLPSHPPSRIETTADALPFFHRVLQSLFTMKDYYALCNDPSCQNLQLACDLWTAAFFQVYQRENIPFVTTETLRTLDPPSHLHSRVEITTKFLPFFHWVLEFPSIMEEGGFDVVLGNPPFLGGLKISSIHGDKYRQYLRVAYAPFGGTADLCAAFFRRAYQLLRPGGRFGLVATNTISQGDTRESGLAPILREGGTITFAKRFIKWPGVANVEVNLVTLQKPAPNGVQPPISPILDGQPVPFISSRLDTEPEAEPQRLRQNEGKAFQGSIVLGMGFVLEPWEAEKLRQKDPRNADCLFPYLNGEDLNTHPQQQPSRWVIQFDERSQEEAQQYPDLWNIVRERVLPERQLKDVKKYPRMVLEWWKHWNNRKELYRAIAPLRRVLVRAQVSEMHAMVFVPKGWIYSMMTIVFAFDDDYHFALLQSSVHEVWVWRNASSLRTDTRYTPTDCFDTFPFPPTEYEHVVEAQRAGSWRVAELPEPFQQAAQIGAAYHEHRRQVMGTRQVGLTKTYNLLHSPDCQEADIVRLRELHAAMDRAILACYGWGDVELAHSFYPNDRGKLRYTIAPAARQALLARLLALNLRLSQ